MNDNTESSQAKPLFPEGTPCEVIDPEGKLMFSGFYVYYRKAVTCLIEDERPENCTDAVFQRSMTGWGLPETWELTEVTPPYQIVADKRAIALALHDGTTWVMQRECTREAVDDGEMHWLRCSECQGAIARWDRYCSFCGAKVVEE